MKRHGQTKLDYILVISIIIAALAGFGILIFKLFF